MKPASIVSKVLSTFGMLAVGDAIAFALAAERLAFRRA